MPTESTWNFFYLYQNAVVYPPWLSVTLSCDTYKIPKLSRTSLNSNKRTTQIRLSDRRPSVRPYNSLSLSLFASFHFTTLYLSGEILLIIIIIIFFFCQKFEVFQNSICKCPSALSVFIWLRYVVECIVAMLDQTICLCYTQKNLLIWRGLYDLGH